MAEKTYYIVNPRGAIHECTRDHAAWRLQMPGWRVPIVEELNEYLMRQRAGQDQSKPFMQILGKPIAKPWNPDPDVAMGELEQALEDVANMTEDLPNATEHAIGLAKELGIDLGEVDGSGEDGKILKGDVMERYGVLGEDDSE